MQSPNLIYRQEQKEGKEKELKKEGKLRSLSFAA